MWGSMGWELGGVGGDSATNLCYSINVQCLMLLGNAFRLLQIVSIYLHWILGLRLQTPYLGFAPIVYSAGG